MSFDQFHINVPLISIFSTEHFRTFVSEYQKALKELVAFEWNMLGVPLPDTVYRRLSLEEWSSIIFLTLGGQTNFFRKFICIFTCFVRWFHTIVSHYDSKKLLLVCQNKKGEKYIYFFLWVLVHFTCINSSYKYICSSLCYLKIKLTRQDLWSNQKLLHDYKHTKNRQNSYIYS